MELFNQDVGEYNFAGKKPEIFPRQVIAGKVPAKSNCYRITKIPGKAEPVDCPDCDGSNDVRGPKCKTCGGAGVVQLKGGEHYTLVKRKELLHYEKAFAWQCTKYRNLRIDGSLRFCMDVYFERLGSDIDNSLKIVLDCLASPKIGVNGIVNDNRVDELQIRKFKDKDNPRIEFHIERLGPSQIKSSTKTKKTNDTKTNTRLIF